MRTWILWAVLSLSSGALADLCPGSFGGPNVATPGSIGCSSELIATGTRTTFSVMSDSILDWKSLSLPAGDELVFDFVGGESVANRLGPGGTHRIDGAVMGNGKVGFFASGSNLEVGGSVSANEVVLSGLSLADSGGFLSGGAYQLEGSGGLLTGWLTVSGMVEATNGDVVMAGGLVRIRGDARVNASDAVRVGAGRRVDVAASGERRLVATGESENLQHLGDSQAGLLEFVATREIVNAGRIEASGGFGKVFFEVGPGGAILNEGTGVILGQTMMIGDFDSDGVVLDRNEGDGLALVNASVVKISALKRPDGRQVSKAHEIATSASTAGSADAFRKTTKSSRKVVKRDRKPMLRRQSFFGMRGSQKSKRLSPP